MSSPIQPSHSRTQEELDEEVRRIMARKSRRSFLVGGAAVLATFGAYEWLDRSALVDQLQRPLRMAEDTNGRLFQAIFRDRILAPTYSSSQATKLRVNGDIGLDEDLILDSWRLQVVGLDRPAQYSQFTDDVDLWDYRSTSDPPAPYTDASQGPDLKRESGAQQQVPLSTGLEKTPGILLTLADLRKLPQVGMVTQFKCIEGWSQIVEWEGVRFRDFVKAYPPRLNSDGSLPRYVAMETPEGDFFAGFDIAAVMHPQTLLCYAMGGAPLTPEHGAPLRLAMPIKYGYKQIKQIAKVTYANQRPADYWANAGYDWYGGL